MAVINKIVDAVLFGKTTPQQQTLMKVIVGVAQSLKIDPVLAVSIAIMESGLDAEAIGDGGRSYGLYQLNVSGELGLLTMQEAFDPKTNATIALSELASVEKHNPFMPPGQLAAAAQRPKNRAFYAMCISTIYPLAGQLLTKLRIYPVS